MAAGRHQGLQQHIAVLGAAAGIPQAPLLLEKSLQAKFLVPMGVSLGFGVIFATVITLILVPSMYLILEDIRNFFLGPKDKL